MSSNARRSRRTRGCPWSANDALSLAMPSTVVPGRGNSSTASAIEPSGLVIGTTLRSKRPSAIAAAARSWLSTANASTSSRVKPSIVAIRSAEMPWGTSGNISRSAALPDVKSGGRSSTGQRDIDSTPPPTTRCWWPAWMPIAAKVTACWPEPQNRLSVTPGASTGQPAASTAIRPMQPPWSPAGLPLPMMTSSTSVMSMPGARGQGVEHLGEHLLGVDVVQRPVRLALATRRADAVDDPGFGRHQSSVILVRGRASAMKPRMMASTSRGSSGGLSVCGPRCQPSAMPRI